MEKWFLSQNSFIVFYAQAEKASTVFRSTCIHDFEWTSSKLLSIIWCPFLFCNNLRFCWANYLAKPQEERHSKMLDHLFFNKLVHRTNLFWFFAIIGTVWIASWGLARISIPFEITENSRFFYQEKNDHVQKRIPFSVSLNQQWQTVHISLGPTESLQSIKFQIPSYFLNRLDLGRIELISQEKNIVQTIYFVNKDRWDWNGVISHQYYHFSRQSLEKLQATKLSPLIFEELRALGDTDFFSKTELHNTLKQFVHAPDWKERAIIRDHTQRLNFVVQPDTQVIDFTYHPTQFFSASAILIHLRPIPITMSQWFLKSWNITIAQILTWKLPEENKHPWTRYLPIVIGVFLKAGVICFILLRSQSIVIKAIYTIYKFFSKPQWFIVKTICVLVFGLFVIYGIPILWEKQNFFTGVWLDRTVSEWLAAPLASLIHQIIFDGSYPLWNPFNGAGVPLAADIVAGVYSPFHWFAFLYPSEGMWEFIFILRFLVSGVGMLVFLLSCHISRWVALHIALLYMFSGHLFYFGNAWHMNSLALLPFFCFGVQQLFRQKYLSGIPAVAFSWSLIVVGGGMLDMVLSVILCGIVVLIWGLSHPKKQLPSCLLSLSCLLTSGLIGTGIAGIFLLPFFELYNLTLPPWPGRSLTMFNSWQYGLSLFFHQLLVIPPNPSSYYMQFHQYLSIFILLGIVWGMIYLKRANHSQRSWFLGMAVFAVMYLGKLYGIPFLQFLNHTPFVQDIRFEKYVGCAYFSIYAIAAFGLQWALKQVDWKGKLLLIVIAGLPFWFLLQYHLISDFSNVSHTLAYSTMLLLFGALYIRLANQQNSVQYRSIIVCILTLLVGTNIIIDTQTEPWGPANRSGKSYTPQEFDLWMRQQMVANPVRLYDTIIPAKYHLPYRIYDVRDSSNTPLSRHNTILWEYGLRKTTSDRLTMVSSQYHDFNHAVMSFLNVGYYRLSPAVQPINHHEPSEQDGIFFNTTVFPRAFMVYQTHFEPIAEKIRQQIAQDPIIFLEQAWIESPKPSRNLNLPTTEKPASQIHFINYTYNELLIEVQTSQPGMLVVLDQFYPGWTVTVNGNSETLYQVDYLFRGVFLEEGNSNIHFVYQPKSFYYGTWLSIISVILLVIVWLMVRKNSSTDAEVF